MTVDTVMVLIVLEFNFMLIFNLICRNLLINLMLVSLLKGIIIIVGKCIFISLLFVTSNKWEAFFNS